MKFSHFALLLFSLFTSGCFYDAPITEKPSREIDKAVLGEWTLANEPTGKLVVSEIDASTYGVVFVAPKEGDKSAESLEFKGYHSAVGDKDFVSLQLLKPAGNQQGRWLFVTFDASKPDQLEVRSLNNRYLPFPRSIDPDSQGGDELKTAEAIHKKLSESINEPKLMNQSPMLFQKAK